jgi:PhnB protein
MALPIPPGFATLTPHLIVTDGVAAIEFYKQAFGAQERMRMMCPDGKTLMHAQLLIGNSMVMLGGEFPPENLSPKNRGGTTVFIHLYTEDADAAFARAVKAGCTARMPLTDMFWGDRFGQVVDPFGHGWSIATHKQDLSPDQMAANVKAFFANLPSK